MNSHDRVRDKPLTMLPKGNWNMYWFRYGTKFDLCTNIMNFDILYALFSEFPNDFVNENVLQCQIFVYCFFFK